jgi:hypothetical protein
VVYSKAFAIIICVSHDIRDSISSRSYLNGKGHRSGSKFSV